MTSRWNKDTHDIVLVKLHKMGLTDHQIMTRMLDSGIPVAFHDVKVARDRLNLPANKSPVPPPRNDRQFSTTPKIRPNPLAMALAMAMARARATFGARFVEKASGYFLDGVPVSLNQIMRAYNEVQAQKNLPQIDRNAAWVVPCPKS